MLYPKEGTIEALVLAKLIKNRDRGVTMEDFKDHPEVTEDGLEKAVQNLGSGMFESDSDNTVKFDA